MASPREKAFALSFPRQVLGMRDAVLALLKPEGGRAQEHRSVPRGVDDLEPASPADGRIGWFADYAIGTLLLAAVTSLNCAIYPLVDYWTVALVYLLTVLLAAANLRRGATLYVAAFGALIWNFLFIPPRFTLLITKPKDVLMYATYFVVAVVVGHFTTRLRESEQLERRREKRASALYQLTRAMATSEHLDAALGAVVRQLHEAFGADSAIFLWRDDALALHPSASVLALTSDMEAAEWCCRNRKITTRRSPDLPATESVFVPLSGAELVEGALMVRWAADLSLEQRGLLEALAAQVAVFIAKERALEAIRASQLAAKSEQLQKTLFDSVSHELKTPLAAMRVALEHAEPDAGELLQAVMRLTSTVNHLLDATRIESGMLRPSPEWCDVGELIREAINLTPDLASRFVVKCSEELPPIWVDSGLVAQALSNLLTNACNHSPLEATVQVDASVESGRLLLSVSDAGRGIPVGEEVRIFDKFYRCVGAAPGGLGLGLSITRRLVETHAGAVWAENLAAGGARFTIALPYGPSMQLPVEHQE